VFIKTLLFNVEVKGTVGIQPIALKRTAEIPTKRT